MIAKIAVFQFPPLREGRRAAVEEDISELKISIPAPARGATSVAGKRRGKEDISIPAPARGATVAKMVDLLDVIISIPAPARGATNLRF